MLRALLILIALGIAVVLWAVVVERNWFVLRRHRVPCLPPGSDPIRALHISDLHMRAPQRRKRAFLRALDRLEPDLVLATGDLLGDPSSADATIETVGSIRARTAALLVLGSNDYYAPRFKSPLRYFIKGNKKRTHGRPNPWRDMVAGLEQKGWRLINNARAQIDGIEVLGLDDAHIGREDMSLASARTHDGFRLAVAHSPDVAEELARLGYDLIVAGHTHGGQVCIPGYGAIVTNCALPRRMAKGLHRLGDSWLHVSGGLGTSMFAPYRLACRPEACLLELVPRDL